MRPSAAGHYSLVNSDSTFGGKLLESELPSSAAAVYGLKMEVKECEHDTLSSATPICTEPFTVKLGDSGFSPNANINFGGGGFDGLVDNFIATWEGEIYLEESGDYTFYIVSDDGARLLIDGDSVLKFLDGNVATDEEIWADHGTLEAHGEVANVTAGWHRIKVQLYDQGSGSNIALKWTTPTVAEKLAVPVSVLRHPLGNGSYACIGIERDPSQSSFISLNRDIDIENTLVPSPTYLPEMPYYGSITGSELKLFRDVVALDTGTILNVPGANQPAEPHLPNSRLYLDGTTGKSVQTILSMALDLASSRKIIDNLVRSDVENQSIINSAEVLTDADGNRFFTLSATGRMLYQQLKEQQVFGEQTFVVRKGESIQLSGILMKVDDKNSLTSCPIGSSGVVSQFKSGCTKRFSRSLSFAELIQQSYTTFDLNSLLAKTYTSDGNPAGCEMELNVMLSR